MSFLHYSPESIETKVPSNSEFNEIIQNKLSKIKNYDLNKKQSDLNNGLNQMISSNNLKLENQRSNPSNLCVNISNRSRFLIRPKTSFQNNSNYRSKIKDKIVSNHKRRNEKINSLNSLSRNVLNISKKRIYCKKNKIPIFQNRAILFNSMFITKNRNNKNCQINPDIITRRKMENYSLFTAFKKEKAQKPNSPFVSTNSNSFLKGSYLYLKWHDKSSRNKQNQQCKNSKTNSPNIYLIQDKDKNSPSIKMRKSYLLYDNFDCYNFISSKKINVKIPKSKKYSQNKVNEDNPASKNSMKFEIRVKQLPHYVKNKPKLRKTKTMNFSIFNSFQN